MIGQSEFSFSDPNSEISIRGNISSDMEPNTLLFTVAVDNAIIEGNTLKPSLIGMFDLLRKPSDGPLTYSFYVAGKVGNVPRGTINIVSKIVKDDSVLAEQTIIGNVNRDEADIDYKAFFPLFEFREAGKYFIKTTINGVDVEDDDKFYFFVKDVPAPTEG